MYKTDTCENIIAKEVFPENTKMKNKQFAEWLVR